MKKRRVLALLLALSLVVSGNGMTVLAAEQVADMPVLLSQEETMPEGDDLADSSDAETSADDDKTETDKPSDEDSEKVEASDEGKNLATEDPENTAPKGDDAGQEENETPADSEIPEEDDPAAAAGEDGTGELPGGGEENDEQEPETDTAGSISENHAEAPAVVPETVQSFVQPYVSRIVTFTDDTGMRITYDANAEKQYHYVVDENGVLTSVVVRTFDTDGNTIDTPIDFSKTKNVELKQPEEGEKYTSIASRVFGGNTDVTYVKLPEGLETIGKEAFKGCTELKGVYLPAGLTKIEDSAFEGCTKLSQIAVPKTVTEIGDSAFKGDARLHLVYMKDVDYCDLISIGNHAFEGCAVLEQFCSDMEFLLPSKLESIGEGAFQGCKAIKKVDLTNTQVMAMGASAFMGCTGLTELSPGKILPLIPEHAFEGCTALAMINFDYGKFMTIDSYAFANCYNLKQLMLPQTVSEIRDYAFQKCTKLTRVEVENYNITLHTYAFPYGEATGLIIIAKEGSAAYLYARKNGLLPNAKGCYKYKVEDVNGVLVEGGEFLGGIVWVEDADGKNINTLNNETGVTSGTICYIRWKQTTDEQREKYLFISDSLKCNGLPVQVEKKEDGSKAYHFIMPEGGAVITAEFRSKTPGNIKGQQVTIEFSEGEPLYNGEMDENGYKGVELKEGQNTRMFLLDEDGETIPASKIVNIKSGNPKVATVDKNGIISTVGTGYAEITVELRGVDGNMLRPITRTVSVKAVEAKEITIKPLVNEDGIVKISGKEDGIRTAAIDKKFVSEVGLTIKLKANVYDGTGSIGKDLTWTTSNTKVATLEKSKTMKTDPVNIVSIKEGCEGEATITVTANNPKGVVPEKVTQKFVVQVFQEGYKLASPTVTVNPNLEVAGTIELISAYNKEFGSTTDITLYDEGTKAISSLFVAKLDAASSSEKCKRYNITPGVDIENGTYKLKVGLGNGTSEKDWMPLTIIVKKAVPTPTIKFNVDKKKFNLFYKDGRIDANSEPTLVTTEITKLGTAKIKDAKLEALPDSDKDKLFEGNFMIDKANTDLSTGKVVIKRSDENNGNLQYASGKPVVTGNLVIYYEGYKDSAAKKMKVTMPTCTTAPSYALRETKGTYRASCLIQKETFELYDKKSKKKEQVPLNKEEDKIEMEPTDALLGAPNPQIQDDGTIAIESFIPGFSNGKLRFVLRNSNWDLDKDKKERTLIYTYSINVSSAVPTIKANPATITLNQSTPDKDVTFTLVSNQKGVDIDPEQIFMPPSNTSASKIQEMEKLSVTYENGIGRAVIKDGETVKKGSYKFECFPETDQGGVKKVTLTVKVVDNKPTVKLGKGTLQLNLNVFDTNNKATAINPGGDAESGVQPMAPESYAEIAEIPFTVSEKLEGYTLAGVGIDGTEVTCTTKNKAEAISCFDFSVSEEETNMLRVKLKDKKDAGGDILTKGTYTFSMTLKYKKDTAPTKSVTCKPFTFKVKVYDSGEIYVALSAKGKINLLYREEEVNDKDGIREEMVNDKNGIVYTPTLKNITGEIEDIKIYDAGSIDFKKESEIFVIKPIKDKNDKNTGKFFVTPKKTLKDIYQPTPGNPSEGSRTTTLEPVLEGEGTATPETSTEPRGRTAPEKREEPEGTTTPETPMEPGGTAMPEKSTESGGTTAPETPTRSGDTTSPDVLKEYDYASLDANQSYKVQIWVKVKGYAGSTYTGGGVLSKIVTIKTAQVLPKITTDKTALDVYLSTKDYDATFVVKPKEGSVGEIEEIYFGEKDETARESFTLIQTPQKDGSMKVIVHLQEAVGFANGSSNNVKMYVKYKGQGENTSATATSFTMKINVH